VTGERPDARVLSSRKRVGVSRRVRVQRDRGVALCGASAPIPVLIGRIVRHGVSAVPHQNPPIRQHRSRAAGVRHLAGKGGKNLGGSELAGPVCAVAHARVDGPASTAIPPTASMDAIFIRVFNGMPLLSPRREDGGGGRISTGTVAPQVTRPKIT
jgi:hypothetical protein